MQSFPFDRARSGVIPCLLLLLGAAQAEDAPAFQRFVVGNALDVVRPTEGLIVLQGGGDDVDENFVRMGARGGGGDFIVLQASGTDEYNAYIYALCDCDSVETIIFNDRQAAFEPVVIESIRNAEAIFIGGGEQSRYVRFWKDTPVEKAINEVAAKPAPIGGTSAGMAILGEFVYSAMSEESVTTESGLTDPFVSDLTLDRDFLALPRLAGLITDQHLQERHRIGRTIAFLARLIDDGWSTRGRAIAADRETALHVDRRSGIGEVLSTPDHETPYVYFLSTPGPPEKCEPGTPLTFTSIAVYRIGPGGRFDLDAWRGQGGIAYTLSVEAGVLKSSRSEIY